MAIILWIMIQSDIANDLILYFMVHGFCLISPSNRDSQAPIRRASLSSDNLSHIPLLPAAAAAVLASAKFLCISFICDGLGANR